MGIHFTNNTSTWTLQNRWDLSHSCPKHPNETFTDNAKYVKTTHLHFRICRLLFVRLIFFVNCPCSNKETGHQYHIMLSYQIRKSGITTSDYLFNDFLNMNFREHYVTLKSEMKQACHFLRTKSLLSFFFTMLYHAYTAQESIWKWRQGVK